MLQGFSVYIIYIQASLVACMQIIGTKGGMKNCQSTDLQLAKDRDSEAILIPVIIHAVTLLPGVVADQTFTSGSCYWSGQLLVKLGAEIKGP